MNGILHREYGDAAYLKLESGLAIVDGRIVVGSDPFADLPPERRTRLRAISGHMSVGLDRLIARPSRYVTIFRDPIERIVSLYGYIESNPRHRLHEYVAVRRWTLRDFLTQPMPQFNNGQLRLLTGAVSLGCLGHGVEDRDLLEQAIRQLDEQFDLVGTTSRFDDFLVLAWQRYRWQVPLYRPSNVLAAARSRPPLDPDTLALAERLNAMDRQLYQYAERRMARQVLAAGPSFRRHAAAFQLLNSFGGRT